MRLLVVAAAFAVGLGYVSANPALADAGITPLAASGSWIAAAHRTSMIAAPDVCIAANPVQHVAFRADTDGIELRVSDEKWSLPPNVQGNLTVTIGGWSKSFDIEANTDQMVSVRISEDVLLPMFSAMDKASTMSVVVGNSKPRSASLIGSSKATNAFRTCVGIHSNDQSAGENPFK